MSTAHRARVPADEGGRPLTRSRLAREFWEKRRTYILNQLGELPDFYRIVDEEFAKARADADPDAR